MPEQTPNQAALSKIKWVEWRQGMVILHSKSPMEPGEDQVFIWPKNGTNLNQRSWCIRTDEGLSVLIKMISIITGQWFELVETIGFREHYYREDTPEYQRWLAQRTR